MRKFLTITIIGLSLYALTSVVFAQKKDAIGVRIMPNSDHLPVQIWYQNQDFIKKGNPAPAQVDGYDAVMEGSSVYVNASNIIHTEVEDFYYCESISDSSKFLDCNAVDADGSPLADINTKKQNFWTNVYLISYSESEKTDIKNIFSQILANWKFNTNISLDKLCSGAGDIAECRMQWGGEAGIEEIKQKLRRDTRRLADMAYMQYVLDNYYGAYKSYPKLLAGTYLVGQTISRWPSWQETLGLELGISIPVDPLNIFGVCGEDDEENCYCEGYDMATCWDNNERLFNGETDIVDGMPEGAYAYYYKSMNNGGGYEFNAANWETPYVGGQYIANMQASHSAQNTSPIIEDYADIIISPGIEKTIELKAYDYDLFTKNLTWEFGVPPFSGTNDGGMDAECDIAVAGLEAESVEGCCVKKIIISDIAATDKIIGGKFLSARQIKITAANAAVECSAKINIKVKDGNGADALEDEAELKITVKNNPPFISGLSEESGIEGSSFESKIIAQDIEGDNISFLWLKASPSSGSDCLANLTLDGGKIGGLEIIGDKIKGIPNTIGKYCAVIKASDEYNEIEYIAKLNIENKMPKILSPSLAEAVAGQLWEFNVEIEDDFPPTTYKLEQFVCADGGAGCKNWFSFGNEINPPAVTYIVAPNNKAKISGIPLWKGTHKFKIKVIENYNKEISQDFTLNISNTAPVIDSTNCTGDIFKGTGEKFKCSITASDKELHPLSYSFDGNYGGVLNINNQGGVNSGGKFTEEDFGVYDVKILVKDDYGGEVAQEFKLTVGSVCGDGKIEGAEECDDTNAVDSDACSNLCKWTYKKMGWSDIKGAGLGIGNGIIWGNNNNQADLNEDNGDFLKVYGVMPTPYIWVVNTNESKVAKIRTFSGCLGANGTNCLKRTVNGWDSSASKEEAGKIIGEFNLEKGSAKIINPSRTAVDPFDGSVWIAGRDSGNVAKLDINGNVKKICATGGGPRGVAIDKNGDAWISNADDDNAVKISGDDSDCSIKAIVSPLSDRPYGLAVDKYGYIWSVSRSESNNELNSAQKIDPSTNKVIKTYPGLTGAYGIAIDNGGRSLSDMESHIWVGDYEGNGVYELNQTSGEIEKHSLDGCSHSRGVTIDLYGNMWIACSTSGTVHQINLSNPLEYSYKTIYASVNPAGGFASASFPAVIGMCGDSAGYVWAVDNGGSYVYAFSGIDGAEVRKIAVSGNPYTYSDMTGLNRAMALNMGVWQTEILDSAQGSGNYIDQRWGKIVWDEVISGEQTIDIEIRISNSSSDILNKIWVPYDPVAVLSGRFLQIKITLYSSDDNSSPVFTNLRIE